MGSSSLAELEGGVDSLFLEIDNTFLIYKQLLTQGTILSCSLNKLDVKNQLVLLDLENPQTLSTFKFSKSCI